MSAGNEVPVVGIGASAGGLEATEQLLRALPGDTGMAFVVIHHLPPARESMLAEVLSRSCAMSVMQIQDGPSLQPNMVYVIPPGHTLTILDGALHLAATTGDSHIVRPIDAFFTSLAEDRANRAIGVVLSGMGNDGTAGLQAIKAGGGITFAQDDSAQQPSMPRSAVTSGAVDFILPPAEIAAELVRVARHPYVVQGDEHDTTVAPGQAGLSDLQRILALLRQATGVDFSVYKFNTLHRRIHRRMVLLRLDSLQQYATYLQRNPGEIDGLYQDILISVTTFFRNPEAFDAIKSHVLPRLLKDRPKQDALRIWCVGCSTGEEAYSLAIVVAEHLSEIESPLAVQVYATDVNGAAIDRARLGFYSSGLVHDVSPERLRRFFTTSDGGYRISKSIRDMCVFARQNVLADPPFSRIDLISCRNVLIYIEQPLQRKLMPMLHYALKPGGFLLLGSSETIGSFRDLFDSEDAKNKIYIKKNATVRPDSGSMIAGTPVTPGYLERRAERVREGAPETGNDIQREADRVLLSRYVPAGVLVNAEFEVMQFRGDTGMFLSPAPGKASLNLLKMAREGLMVSLRAALHRAKKEDAAIYEEGVRVRTNGGYHEVNLSVIPLGSGAPAGRCYLVLFEDPAAPHRVAQPSVQQESELSKEDSDRRIQRLTQELAATREYLQSVIEQQEAANEELQSANEEVQSANEELQSINEELETSKEEIQSSNEELITVNEELQNRNEELNRVNNDVNNLLASVQMAMIMVWQDLRIRRFTPMAEKLLNLIATDVGRPIGDIKLNIDGPDIGELAREVIDTVAVKELEVKDKNSRWYSLRVRPYRTMENKIDGAVIMLVDIHDLKRTQETLSWQARILEQTHEPVVVRTPAGQIVFWNRGAEGLYGYGREDAVGRISRELLATQVQNGENVEQAVKQSGRWDGELLQRTKGGRTILVESNVTLLEEAGQVFLIETHRDITRRKELEEALRNRVRDLAMADQQKNEFVAMLAHELRNPLAPMRNALEIIKAKDALASPEQLKLREMMERQVSKMARIVNDLLDAAKVSRQDIQLRREPLDVRAIVERSVELLQYAIRARGQRLTVSLPDEPMNVLADSTRLEQVFGNLLENSVKFTPEAGEIAITVARDRDDAIGECVRVSIEDSGAGIAPDMLPRVFDLFVQGDQSLARTGAGLGIGLNLVRNLVERHGGRVSVHSEGAGHGATFVVRLPLVAGVLPKGD